MAYAEVKGSRKKRKVANKEMFVEIGVELGTTAYTHPARGSQSSYDISVEAATSSTGFVCTNIQEDPDTLPGITFVTSTFERFVGYAE